MDAYFGFFDTVPDFASISSEEIRYITDKIVKKADTQLSYILRRELRTFENTMEEWDNLLYNFGSVSAIIFLLSHVSPDEETYEQANESFQVIQRYNNGLSLNEDLYRAIRSYSQTDEAKTLTGDKKKFLEETLKSFERNGFALAQEDREILREYKNQLSVLTTEFGRNIAQHQDSIEITAQDAEGLPLDYLERHKVKRNTYQITLDYPSYRPFMQYAKNDELRKELYIKFLNKGTPKNKEVLQKIIELRQKMANLLGFETYAAYILAERMAKNPETVWNFEKELTQKVKRKASADYQELLTIKRKYNDSTLKHINSWESAYYNTLLLQQNYQLDNEEVKQYFQLEKVFKGIFDICYELFGIEFELVEEPSVWHQDVEYYKVTKEHQIIGHLYLDLFPRKNKYGHAACFGIVGGKQTEEGYQTPITALVCNFTPSTETMPSLLTHDQVTTVFHEFGHGLHQLLTTSALNSFAGTNVSRDFVEVPSQLFENWAWDYDVLTAFAKHYQTGEVLPRELFDKMLAARNVGSGLFTLQQILYGTFDLYLHDKYQAKSNENINQVFARLQNEITPYAHVEGTDFPSGFGHLTGYAAGYYGYLWAKVYAEDIFSIFEQEGVLNPKTGEKYLQKILSKGGSEDEMQQLLNFLGREPEQEAFLKSLGLESTLSK